LFVGFVVATASFGEDSKAKALLVGKWAPVAESKDDDAAKTKPAAKPAAGKMRGKTAKAAKPPEPLPKFLIEFTKDGKVRLDGDPSTMQGALKFINPLEITGMKLGPQAKAIKINYKFTAEEQVEVAADHMWLMEKLSGGATEALSPAKLEELRKEYQPRETLGVAVTSKELTLTNEQGKPLKFRRYAGKPLAEAEAERTAQDLERGLDPLRDYMRQQGINIAPAPDAPKKKTKRGQN
jgi:hypothetical protein